MAKNIVIGVGNILFSDDGIGVIAASFLRQNYSFSSELEILDGGTLGFNLIDYFVNYDNVFIIDTISIDDEVGSIYKIPSSELLGSNGYKNTAHEVEVLQMIEACELYDTKADITIFGIVPLDIQTTKIGLSEIIKEKFDIVIKELLKSIKKLGVEIVKKDKVSLENIIKDFTGR